MLLDLWRKLSIYVVIPSLIIASVNAYRLWKEHWEHVAHEPPIEERVEYPYMNIRTKAYPWGDGDKVGHHFTADEGVQLTYLPDTVLEPKGQPPQARRGIDDEHLLRY